MQYNKNSCIGDVYKYMDIKLIRFNILLVCITALIISAITFCSGLNTNLKLTLSILSIIVIWILAGYRELKISRNILKNNK